ncbi:hypothetical protein VPH35_106188 [Triticum aestivum]
MAMDKVKEVVPLLEKGKEVVPPLVDVLVQDHSGAKWRNYGRYHQESGSSHFSKVILAPKLERLSLPLDFTKHFRAIPTEFKLKTYTGCAWRVTVTVINSSVTLDKGWATFAAFHQIMIGHMPTFKLLTPYTMKVIVFNDDGVEVVTKCKEHDNAFAVTA